MGDKASPDMAGRLLEDWVGGGRSDWDAVSCIIERRLLKKSVTLVLVASWVREIKTEVCFCGVKTEETRYQRRWGAWSGSQAQTLGMLEHNLFYSYPRLKTTKVLCSGLAYCESFRPFLRTHESQASQGHPCWNFSDIKDASVSALGAIPTGIWWILKLHLNQRVGSHTKSNEPLWPPGQP